MDLAQRTAALLSLVEQYRARRRDELLQPALAEARAQLRAARTEARQRVRRAVAEERKRQAIEVGRVEAALATERRLRRQQHAVRLLEDAWPLLRERLRAHWAEPGSRVRWIEAHLRRALAAVPTAGSWRVEHAPDLDADECRRISSRLLAAGVAEVGFSADADIPGGFRVVSGHNLLDATLDGLLADRARLEGRLLHHLGEDRP
jgi:hypothetical protein